MDHVTYVKNLFRRSIEAKQKAMETIPDDVVAMALTCANSLKSGGKILFCGNGGSAADAQHLAAELLIRLRSEVDRAGLPALALAMDSSSMTACGNDYSYTVFYERMVLALGKPGDVLIGLTTSGKSENIILALKAARTMGITTLGFLGGDGGPAREHCDQTLIAPTSETGRVQEIHITAGHAMMELIEEILIESKYIEKI
ncbi:D-sedoheptulose-7-phosphate isomerase [Insolitispirillum peregrinum]|uniref:Phosphoheptose isomerase n=1 Tax=Insolitispirillum peregrinum TaxID=80876 RepID=A0A1N7JD10_9PROT|nr:SIS domain-containing protein [Insolitispirillum peregrinum]SIS47209.1 D-sedoheptulose 7-phosphate isomerase [Insolitispirillum peregrinum]